MITYKKNTVSLGMEISQARETTKKVYLTTR